MKPVIQKEQSSIENQFFTLQASIEETALELSKNNPEKANQFLTEYSVNCGNIVMQRWKNLGIKLISDFTR